MLQWPHPMNGATHIHGFRVATVFGTRPEAIKLMPVLRALGAYQPEIGSFAISTSQHTDLLAPLLAALNINVFRHLGVLQPGQSLDLLLGRLMTSLDPVLNELQPHCIVVQGDTTSALAGALCGFHRRVPVVHVEAGLRSGDPTSPFPEELNRRLISQLATCHMAATRAAADALLGEGIAADRIVLTGNPIVDATRIVRSTIAPSADVTAMLRGLEGRKLLLVTTHRRENFGNTLKGYLTALRDFTARHRDVTLLFPVHPNPSVRAECASVFQGDPNIRLIDPMIYPDFLHVLDRAWMIASDSGGIQEEAATLGKPILILRDTTERPEVISAGFGQLVGRDAGLLTTLLEEAYAAGPKTGAASAGTNPFGNGDAGTLIAARIAQMARVARHDLAHGARSG
jgi:UDP-N-acetylglucosamine 2-epimerase (non-hydrolysing)